MKLFRKDTYVLGVLTGIVLPVILYGIMYLVDMQFDVIFEKHLVRKPEDLYLLSVIANIFSLRYFFNKVQKTKAGAGVLIATIAIVLWYFYNYYEVVPI
jgi:hypothetical protein